MAGAIDSHVHLYPPEVNADPEGWARAAGERQWAVLCTRRRKDGRAVQGFPSAEGLLRAMDAAGVERAALQGWYWEKPSSCERQNAFFAACVRGHPDRLSAFAAIHPALGVTGLAEAVRRARDEGFSGLGELSPHAQGFRADDPAWAGAMALAGELGLPVTLHATDPECRPYPGMVPTPPDDFLALAKAFSQTRFILAHWGGLLPLRHPEARRLPNVFYDTAASPLMYGPGIWPRFLAAVDPRRVLFGTDYPLNLYPKRDSEPGLQGLLDEARQAGLPGETLARILRENSLALWAER